VPISYRVLQRSAADQKELSRGTYWANWRNDFDYVLMMYAGGCPDLDHYLPDQLTLLTQSDVAALFKIKHPSPR
jgi:hypothetical protein